MTLHQPGPGYGRLALSGKPRRRVPEDMGRQLLLGFLAVGVLAGGLGGWAATAELAGAVIGVGTVVVDSNVKKVQHPTGGIVGEIRVRDGSRVAEGELVVKLDETVTRANLGVITSQLDEIAIRQARLIAERDAQPHIEIPLPLVVRAGQPEVARIIAGEQVLFVSRRTSREGQKAQLAERLNQLGEEIRGLQAQHAAKSREHELILIELQEIEKLWEKNLAPLSRRIALNREATRIDGERAQLVAATAQVRARVAETQLQIIQLENDLRTEVTKEMRELQARQAELNERRVAAEDQLRRVELRAPQAGIVHQLAVHTVGGVINPAEPVMLIVPYDEVLVLEVKVAPQEISQVRAGQSSFVRFTAFNQSTTPEVKGQVIRVSPDLLREPQTNAPYYNVRVGLADEELKRLGDQRLVPGMPAEVYIQTAERTAISYFMKPLLDQVARAFRER